MKPRSTIDNWLRESCGEYQAMGKPTNQEKNTSLKSHRHSHSRNCDGACFRHFEDAQLFLEDDDSKCWSKKNVEKRFRKLSKLSNVFGADTSYGYHSDPSTRASCNTSCDWLQCNMGDSFVYEDPDGSPITISSGYGSDFMPTCEEEIDSLLYTDRHCEKSLQRMTETFRHSKNKRDQTQTNFRAWPGRHDLFDQERIERHNYKLTKVKKSMRGIIKDLKDRPADSEDVSKSRRSHSFDNMAGKSPKDKRDKERCRWTQFSDNRCDKTDGYMVMDCKHGGHWVDRQSPLIWANQDMKPIVDERKKERNKNQRPRNRYAKEASDGLKHGPDWLQLANSSVTPGRVSSDTLRDCASPLGAPLMSSSPKPPLDLDDRLNDNAEEHIYETIPGDDYYVEIAHNDTPPELPERNYKKRGNTKSDDKDYWPAKPLNRSCDVNNNVVPKFWDRLDGVSRDTRDKTNCTPASVNSGRPRRSPLSSRRSREARRFDTNSKPLSPCAKSDKKKSELDILTLKTKTQAHHEYTVADVLDSISRFERDDPDLIQNVPWCEWSFDRDCCEGKLFDNSCRHCDLEYPRWHPQWSSNLLAADEIII